MPHEARVPVCPTTGRAMPPAPSSPRIAETVRSAAELPPTRDVKRDLVGRRIGGRYVIRGVLGEGGMGTVYEAEHLGLGRMVAVKVLNPIQAKKTVAVKRFQQEARAAGSIGHPNICEVYDLGTLEDGCPFLVMERLVGQTLADRIQEKGGLPTQEVIDIHVQVLSGLIAAHEKGVVHRDIKPENVFLAKRPGCPDIAKLLDFGVSKFVAGAFPGDEEEMNLTRTGMVMGTPYYMSPEQARGDRNLDARVDVYAAGVMMYEALAGRRPFVAPNYNALLMQIITTAARPLREHRPDVSHQLEAVVARAMAKSRADRYQTAAEFQRDLVAMRERRSQQRGPGVAAAPVPLAPPSAPPMAPPPPPTEEERQRAPKIKGRPRQSGNMRARPPSGLERLPRLDPQSSSSMRSAAQFDETRFEGAVRRRPTGTGMTPDDGSIDVTFSDSHDGLDFDDIPTRIQRPEDVVPPPARRPPSAPGDWEAETIVRPDPLRGRPDPLRAPKPDPDATLRMDVKPRRPTR